MIIEAVGTTWGGVGGKKLIIIIITPIQRSYQVFSSGLPIMNFFLLCFLIKFFLNFLDESLLFLLEGLSESSLFVLGVLSKSPLFLLGLLSESPFISFRSFK